jgi:3'(2'), 5'-bisphosphate nucleotidase
MGVVGAPALPEPKTYLGVVGQGAFVEVDATGHRQRIECASFSEDDEGLILVASASHNTPATEEFLAKYKNRSVKSLGSRWVWGVRQ